MVSALNESGALDKPLDARGEKLDEEVVDAEVVEVSATPDAKPSG
jgi:hypothetical protein